MIIRPAKCADAEEIVAIWNPFITSTEITFTTVEKTLAGIECDISSRGAGFQVLEYKGQVKGFATFFQFRAGPGYARTMEHSIILAPEAQGCGQGARLMNVLQDEGRLRDVHSLWAGVSSANVTGIKFHENIGFQLVARLPEVGFKFNRWFDLILLQKIL